MDTVSLFEKYYFGRPGFTDGTTQFHRVCGAHIAPGSRILDIGAGPSNQTSAYLSSLGTVVGVDVSSEILGNWHLHERAIYDGRTLPFVAGTFDACVSDYVLEHLSAPGEHFREVARVLRPGGVYCLRTPNLWHYVSLTSKILPQVFHRLLANTLRGFGSDAHAPYATFYRANTRRAIARLCSREGLRVIELHRIEKEPSYGKRHAILFFPMLGYERVVNSTDAFQAFRSNMLVVLKKNPPG